jgi:hypothetical protein
MRMFLQIDPLDMQRDIQAIQMDIRIAEGAIPAELPVHPARNDNTGPGNVHAHSVGGHSVGVPWALASVIAKSPTENFDALMVHAGSGDFIPEQLADLVDDPGTSCTDTVRCAFVEDALAHSRVYLGFMNVTRTGSASIYGNPHDDPIFGADRPSGPFFIVQVGNIEGIGDAAEAARDLVLYYGGTGWIAFLPEPSTVFVLGCTLAMLVPLRRSATRRAR